MCLPGAQPATVLVRHGRNRYKVRVPQGLKEATEGPHTVAARRRQATFGDLADFLVAQMLPPGIPAAELRLISKGKTVGGLALGSSLCLEASREDCLSEGGAEMSGPRTGRVGAQDGDAPVQGRLSPCCSLRMTLGPRSSG